jgi:acetyl esterase/lipase
MANVEAWPDQESRLLERVFTRACELSLGTRVHSAADSLQESSSFKGVWIMHKPEQAPDIVIYYAHGGGFALGSCYFYLEFLLAWHHLLVEAGYKNPAIFAIEYTLAPDQMYPKQVTELLHGYNHVLDWVEDASRVCVAGDSAGATLMLNLLQELGAQSCSQKHKSVDSAVGRRLGPSASLPLPNLAVLISPWVTLVAEDLHRSSRIDYLDRQTLWTYAYQYAGDNKVHKYPASPGNCTDMGLWKAASPRHGYFVTYGEEEVFAPDVENFLKQQTSLGINAEWLEFKGEVHAWPVVSLFLSDSIEKRLQGLKAIMGEVSKRFDKQPTRRGWRKGDERGQIRSSR